MYAVFCNWGLEHVFDSETDALTNYKQRQSKSTEYLDELYFVVERGNPNYIKIIFAGQAWEPKIDAKTHKVITRLLIKMEEKLPGLKVYAGEIKIKHGPNLFVMTASENKQAAMQKVKFALRNYKEYSGNIELVLDQYQYALAYPDNVLYTINSSSVRIFI